MTIENSVSNDFLSTFVDSINVFDCRLPGVLMFLSDTYFKVSMVASVSILVGLNDQYG